MTSNTVTLDRLRTLAEMYESGFTDQVVDLTVKKLIESQLQRDEIKLEELAVELRRYETQFSMMSPEFYEKYQRGEMGDNIEMFEWSVLYEMHMRLQGFTNLLEAQLVEK